MRHPLSDAHAPPQALLGALMVACFAVAATALVRIGGISPDSEPVSDPVASRDLRFEDGIEGGVLVREASGAEITRIAPGDDGFLRGVMRGLARERLRRDLGPEQPFRLVRWSDGRLSLYDPATGRRIDLESFGPTNAQAFARLLKTGSATP